MATGVGTTLTATLNGVAPSSLVVFETTCDTTGAPSISVSDDLSVVATPNIQFNETLSGQRLEHWYFQNYGGGNRVFTQTCSVSTQFRGIVAIELSGAALTGVAGPTSGAQGTSAAPNSGAVTPAQNGAWFLGTAGYGGNTPAPVSPFATLLNDTLGGVLADYIQPTAASQASAWTMTSGNWGAIVSTYYPAAAVPLAASPSALPRGVLLLPSKPFGPNNPLVEVKYYSPPPAAGGINTPIGLDVASTFDPAFAMQSGYQRALAVATAWTVALLRQLAVLRALSVGSAFNPAIARGAAFLRSLGVSSTFGAATQRGVGRALSVSSTFTASLTAGRSYARGVAASSAFNPALIRALGYQRALAIASSFTATLTRAAAHPRTLAVTSAFSVSLQRSIGKALAVSSAFTAAVLRTTAYKRSLAITSTFAPVLGRTAAHAIALAVAATFTAAMTVGRGFFRTVGAASVFTPSIAKLATHAYFQTLAVASSFTASITRRAAYLRTLAVNNAWTIALTRLVARNRTLAATSPVVVALRRGIALRLGVSSIFSASIVRGLSRLLAVVAPFLVALAKGAKSLFDGFLTHIQSAFQMRAVGGSTQQTESKPHAAYEIRRSG